MAASAPAETVSTKILEFLRKASSPKKANEVAEHLSITKKEANTQLYSMEKKKTVTRRGSNPVYWEVNCDWGDCQERPAPTDTDRAIVPVGCKELCKTPSSSLTAVTGVTEFEQMILNFLKENKGRQTALDIAKGVGKQTTKEVNPMLYSLKNKGRLIYSNKQWSIKEKEEMATTGDNIGGTRAGVGSLSGKQLEKTPAQFGQNEENQMWPSGYQTQTRGGPPGQQSYIRATAPSIQSKVQNVQSWEQLCSQEKPLMQQAQNQAELSIKQTQSEAATLAQKIQKQIGSVSQPSPNQKHRVNEGEKIECQVKEGREEQSSDQTMPLGQEAQSQEAQALNNLNNIVEQAEQLANDKAESSGNQSQNEVEHHATSLVQQANNKAVSLGQQALTNDSQTGKLAFNVTTALEQHEQMLVAPMYKKATSLAIGKIKDSVSIGEKQNIMNKNEFSEAGMALPFLQNMANAFTDYENTKPIILTPPQSRSSENTIQYEHEQHVILHDIRDHLIRHTAMLESLRQAKEANSAMLRRKLNISRQQAKATKMLADAVSSCTLQIHSLHNWLQGNAMPSADQACTSNKVQDALAQIAMLLEQQNSLAPAVKTDASRSVKDTPLLPSLSAHSPEQEISVGSCQGRDKRKIEQSLCVVSAKCKK